MSYCRWSSDDYQCDVYVYADVRGGFTTHVAGRRVVFDAPLPPPLSLRRGFTDAEFHAWWQRQQIVSEMVDRSERVDIGLPHDGETFNDPTPGGCARRLMQLRDLGYNVPAGVIEALREEAVEDLHEVLRQGIEEARTGTTRERDLSDDPTEVRDALPITEVRDDDGRHIRYEVTDE